MKNRSFYLFLIIFSSLYSCSKQELEKSVLPSEVSKETKEENFRESRFAISNQIMEFKDSLEYLSLKQKLISFEVQNEFKSGIKSKKFESLADYYSNLDDSFYENLISTKGYQNDDNYELITYIGEPTIEYTVPEYEIQLILNKQRQLIIGKELYTFFYDYVNILNLENGSEYKKSLNRVGISNPGLKVSATGQEYAVSGTYSYGGKDYRYILHSESVGFNSNHFYKAKIKTKHQKKFLGTFFNSQCTQILMNGNAESGVYLPPYGNQICGQYWTYRTYGGYCTSCSNTTTDIKDWSYDHPCFQNINAEVTFICKDGLGRVLSLNHSSPW